MAIACTSSVLLNTVTSRVPAAFSLLCALATPVHPLVVTGANFGLTEAALIFQAR